MAFVVWFADNADFTRITHDVNSKLADFVLAREEREGQSEAKNDNQLKKAMPEAVLTLEQWEAIKAASIRGVADQDLADEFGIEKNAIHQRRFRDEIWKAAIQSKTEAVRECKKGVETAFLAQKVALKVSESSQALSDSNLLLASRIAQKGLKRADREIDLVPVENIADIERIVKIAAIAGKWNRPEVSVNQSFAFGGGQEDSQIVECETEIVEDSGQYGDSFGVDEGEG